MLHATTQEDLERMETMREAQAKIEKLAFMLHLPIQFARLALYSPNCWCKAARPARFSMAKGYFWLRGERKRVEAAYS